VVANQIESALKVLKRVDAEGARFKKMKQRASYEKLSGSASGTSRS
jgi:ribosomal protein S21